MIENRSIAAIIPTYRVKDHLASVVAAMPEFVDHIIVVNDACPDESWRVLDDVKNPRLTLLHHELNLGVGGAVMTGYAKAIDLGADILVKVDGDGQMDPELIPLFVEPILRAQADYTKGNRFFNPQDVIGMPLVRLIGNAGLSFLSKLSTGYWQLFDPTNGFTAIHARVAALLPFEKIDNRYFFESDLLFRLNTIQAVVMDLPMRAVYSDEHSSLDPRKEIWPFFCGHLRNFGKRIFYNYFLRSFSIASLELMLGFGILMFGLVFGTLKWVQYAALDQYASIGTVMLTFLTIMIGIQFLISFINFDVGSVPKAPIWPHMRPRRSIKKP